MLGIAIEQNARYSIRFRRSVWRWKGTLGSHGQAIRFRAVLVILCILLLCPARANARDDADQMYSAIVSLEYIREDPTLVLPSTGTMLDDRTVLASYHVMDGARAVWVNLGPDGVRKVAEVVKTDRIGDLVVLRLDNAVPLRAFPRVATTRPEADGLRVCRRMPSGELQCLPAYDVIECDLGLRTVFSARIAGVVRGWSGAALLSSDGTLHGILSRGDDTNSIASPVRTARLTADEPGQTLAAWRNTEGGAEPNHYYRLVYDALVPPNPLTDIGAKAALTSALRVHPTGFRALRMYCDNTMVLSNDKVEAAERAFDLSKSADIEVVLADAMVQARDPRAWTVLTKLSEQRSMPQAHCIRVWWTFEAGRVKDAIALAQEGVKRWPDHFVAAKQYYDIAKYARDYTHMRAAAAALVAMYPTRAEYRVQLGYAQERSGQHDEYTRTLQSLRETAPFDAIRLQMLVQEEPPKP